MKNILFASCMSAALFLSACSSNTNQENVSKTDTAGLAAFKMQQAAERLAADHAATSDSIQLLKDSIQKMNEVTSTKEITPSKNMNKISSKSESKEHYNTNSSVSKASSSSNSPSYATNTTTRKKKRKGMSHATKGALIGTGVGAVGGAIIGRGNRGLGAVVGGVVGAGTGYMLGKSKDKKENQ